MMVLTRLAHLVVASVLLGTGPSRAEDAGAKVRPDAIQIARSDTMFWPCR